MIHRTPPQVVGILERENDTHALLEHQLSWPASLHTTGRKGQYHTQYEALRHKDADADLSLRDRIRELNRFDEILYRAANDIVDRRLAQLRRQAPG